MATAEKKTREIEKTVFVDEVFYTLELTEEEAIALRAVVGSVGGGSQGRKAVSRVFSALNNAGLEYYTNTKVRRAVDNITGSISFGGE